MHLQKSHLDSCDCSFSLWLFAHVFNAPYTRLATDGANWLVITPCWFIVSCTAPQIADSMGPRSDRSKVFLWLLFIIKAEMLDNGNSCSCLLLLWAFYGNLWSVYETRNLLCLCSLTCWWVLVLRFLQRNRGRIRLWRLHRMTCASFRRTRLTWLGRISWICCNRNLLIPTW